MIIARSEIAKTNYRTVMRKVYYSARRERLHEGRFSVNKGDNTVYP